MLIGNVVDDTYTGVLDVKVTLTFYAGKPAVTPDKVLTLGADNTLATPRNSERVLAEVYATGSGGGCEEFWYLAVPDKAPYSCQADNGPYREVQIKVDGQLAGIATPFPHVWTGGWSNPFLWYVVPGPRAFDVKPIEYDLTPYSRSRSSAYPTGRAAGAHPSTCWCGRTPSVRTSPGGSPGTRWATSPTPRHIRPVRRSGWTLDRIMDSMRVVTNLFGNCVAVFVVSRWENALDLERAKRVLDGEAVEETPVSEETVPVAQ